MPELVGLGVETPDMLGKLSQLLSIQQQRIALNSQSALAQQEQQTAKQRAAIAKYDWSKHLGADGTIDLNTLNDPELQAAAGDSYWDVVTRAVTAKEHQLEARSRLLGLKNDQRQAVLSKVGALLQDRDVLADMGGTDGNKGRQKVNAAAVELGETYGPDMLPVIEATFAPLKNVPEGRMPDALRAIRMQGVSVADQLEKERPTYQSRGGELVNVNPYTPGAQPAAPTIPLSIPPGFHVVVDPRTQNPYLLNSQTGEVQDMGAGYPGQSPQGAPSPNLPPNTPMRPRPPQSMPAPFYPGQPHDIQAQQSEVANTRTAADAAPQLRNINAEIMRLSKDTATGPGTAAWRSTKFGGMFGDDYQTLGKFLEKQAIANMSAMGGPPSDARLSAAAAANGSTKFNPKALQAVTRFNDATNTALEQYREGVDKAVGTRNPDYAALPDFKAAWARNFDIDIFRYQNAIRDGDQEEIEKLKDEMKRSPARARELQKKSANLEALATTGRLP